MKLKKVMAAALVGVMALSAVGCASGNTNNDTAAGTTSGNETGTTAGNEAGTTVGNTASGEKTKLVVWTLSDDLKSFAEHYMEEKDNVEIETVIIPPADYPTKLSAALGGKAATPDIIIGEPQMLPDFMEAGYFEDLSQAPYNIDEYKDLLVDYIWEAGSDEEGTVRAVSYQVTPGGIFYRRDIAIDVYGTDDPEVIAEKFKDYATIEQTGQDVREKGYRIFADTGPLRWFAISDAWVVDGKVNLSDEKLTYMDAAVNLYQNKLVAFAPEWSAAWYGSMAGEIPMNAEWQELTEVDAGAEKTEVFAYALPSWGALTIRDNAGENAGNYGVCAGPTSFFGGGTFLGISSYSKNKDAAWDFVKYVALTEETSQWWAEVSNGDVVSMISVLEEYKDKENPTYGNQKTYEFFYNEAQKIDYSTVTGYDDPLKTFWGSAIESVQKGERTKEEAIKDFYNNVKSAYPDLEVDQ